MMDLQVIAEKNSRERGALLMSARVLELEKTTQRLMIENAELNRRLNMQNRPHKRLSSAIETGTIILTEHINGRLTGYRAIKKAYPTIGRRKWEMGVAVLRLAGIVTGYNKFGLIFNSNLTINRAWQKYKSAGESLTSVDQLRDYLPRFRQ